jgi:hypothetical protein
MTDRSNSLGGDRARVTAWVVGIIGTFLLMAFRVFVMWHYTRPEPVGANRVAERYKNLKELRETEAQVLNDYDWQNKDKGIVRIPIQRAMELTLKEWQNPAVARSNLIARVKQATAPPPKPPEKPNPYE